MSTKTNIDDLQPDCLEDYLKLAKIKTWPTFVAGEKPINLRRKKADLGSDNDIFKSLKRCTAIYGNSFEQLQLRTAEFNRRLHEVGDQIISPSSDHVTSPGSPRGGAIEAAHPTGDFAATPSSAICSARPLAPASARLNSVLDATAEDELEEMECPVPLKPVFYSELSTTETALSFNKKDIDKSGSLEYCTYVGYIEGEFNTLPSQVEPPQIMHRVTKAQDFTPGFKKFWTKVFQSEASIALMIDSFWWIFIDRFNSDKYRIDKDKLFDRIAECFVHLFISINPEIKDKILKEYASCLSQSIFASYLHCFPKSHRYFHDEFKQYILVTINLWISGTSPSNNEYKSWSLARLSKQSKTGTIANAVPVSQNTGGSNQYSLDMDDVIRCIMSLGHSNQLPGDTQRSSSPQFNAGDQEDLAPECDARFDSLRIPIALSRQAQCGTPSIFPKESHVIGVGADYRRLLFRLSGQSPLVSRYMQTLSLRLNDRGRLVTRTQVKHETGPDATTYKQLIGTSIQHQDSLAKQYSRICEDTKDEIKKIRKETRKSQKIKKKIMTLDK